MNVVAADVVQSLDRTSDESLAERAAAGERDALDQLLRRNFDRVHAICRRITCNPEDAADATQEALIAVCRGIGQFDGRSAFATWLYRVATNAALGEVRRRGRRPVPVLDVPAWAGNGATTPGPDTHLPRRVDIDAALAQLAPEYRAAVILRDLCDLDYLTIAAILEVAPGTVRSRIHRGRQALCRSLQEL